MTYPRRAARIATALLVSLTLTAGPGTHPTPQHPTYASAPPSPTTQPIEPKPRPEPKDQEFSSDPNL